MEEAKNKRSRSAVTTMSNFAFSNKFPPLLFLYPLGSNWKRRDSKKGIMNYVRQSRESKPKFISNV
jgi:hypothetical protein